MYTRRALEGKALLEAELGLRRQVHGQRHRGHERPREGDLREDRERLVEEGGRRGDAVGEALLLDLPLRRRAVGAEERRDACGRARSRPGARARAPAVARRPRKRSIRTSDFGGAARGSGRKCDRARVSIPAFASGRGAAPRLVDPSRSKWNLSLGRVLGLSVAATLARFPLRGASTSRRRPSTPSVRGSQEGLGGKRVRNSRLQRLLSRPCSARFG